MSSSNYKQGILICLLGVLILSPDALIIRLTNLEDWIFLFWRSLFGAVGFFIIILFEKNNKFNFINKFTITEAFAATCFAISNIFFILSITLTTVANTLILLSSAPFFSAIFSMLFLKEKVYTYTWIAIFLVFCSVLLIITGSSSVGGSYGDLFAIGTAISMAAAFTICRSKPKMNQCSVLLVSNIIVLIVGALVLNFKLGLDVISTQQMLLVILDGIVICASFAFLTISTKYITSTEVNLLMTLEAFLGTLLVWLVLSEIPSKHALIGGTIITFTLIIHSLLAKKTSHIHTTNA